jgi:hypothetical protein
LTVYKPNKFAPEKKKRKCKYVIVISIGPKKNSKAKSQTILAHFFSSARKNFG